MIASLVLALALALALVAVALFVGASGRASWRKAWALVVGRFVEVGLCFLAMGRE